MIFAKFQIIDVAYTRILYQIKKKNPYSNLILQVDSTLTIFRFDDWIVHHACAFTIEIKLLNQLMLTIVEW